MESEPGDEGSEFIERWLEEVVEENSVTTKANNHHQNYSERIGGKRKAGSPAEEAQPASKRNVAPAIKPTTRASQSTTGRSVHFSTAETHSEDSGTHHSRSTNVSARVLRNHLSYATPCVDFESVESENRPETVISLFGDVITALEDPIPLTLKEHVKAAERGVGVTVDDLNDEDAQLWKRVRETTSKATQALLKARDEDSWAKPASFLLESTMSSEEQDLFEVIDIPNVSVGPASLIPTIGGEPAAFKKVDIAILFSDSNPELKRLYKVVQKKNGCIELSQSQDATISLCCQFAAIEVKSPDGSYYGSSVQLAIWLAAGLEKTRRLKELAAASRAAVGSGAEGATEETALPPYVGISVVGHVWNLHLAAKMADGDVQIYGPLVLGDTTTTRGTLRIIAALNQIKQWGEAIYYPWLRNEILLPLAGDTESDAPTSPTAGLAYSGGIDDTGGVKSKGKKRA